MTQADIVKTAFSVWGRQLYLSTSLTDIASALGVSKPALYRYFKDKQELFTVMYRCFFDAYAAFIRPAYEQALMLPVNEGGALIFRSITEYYARNTDHFIFLLVKVYGNHNDGALSRELLDRGIDMRHFFLFDPGRSQVGYASTLQLATTTTIFIVAHFHRRYDLAGKTPDETAIKNLIAIIEEKIKCGLMFDRKRVDSLDYERLEQKIGAAKVPVLENNLLQAVASAVAEAGPWSVSMSMVSRKSGLSKSGLYAHFKSKDDMLEKLFSTEFKRLIAVVEAGKQQSTLIEEQLYLVIISIANYLYSRADVLAAIDWLRTRQMSVRLPLEHQKPPFSHDDIVLLSHLFSDFIPAKAVVQESSSDPDETLLTSQWIFFLIVNMLVRRPEDFETPPGTPLFGGSFRELYRFIVLGTGGGGG